jgi:hypothetical protein
VSSVLNEAHDQAFVVPNNTVLEPAYVLPVETVDRMLIQIRDRLPAPQIYIRVPSSIDIGDGISLGVIQGDFGSKPAYGNEADTRE